MRVAAMLVLAGISAACADAATQREAVEERTEVAAVQNPGIGSPSTADATTAALAEFKTRVEQYAELHKQLARGSAEQEESSDPADIKQAQAALARKVQEARSQAKPGDIFTPAVRPVFRRLLAPELKGREGADVRDIIEDDGPAPGSVPFKVNAPYPESQPLPTVPANVLAALPVLPEPLEYRLVDRHLLLLDTDANVIVDYIFNAIAK